MCKILSQRSRGEQGQMLVLIILVIIVLFGFAALAIDGGLVFSNRRAAQNAADAAALAAAYAKCQGSNPVTTAISIAENNGFKNNGADVQVSLNNPPSVGPYATNTSYFEVVITTVTKPVFSQFVTSTPLTSTVRSVSHCKPGVGGGVTQPGLGGEVSVLALSKTASHAFANTGNTTIIVDGGVFINSTAADAIYQTGSSGSQMNWLKARGGGTIQGTFGINKAGTSVYAKEVDIVKDVTAGGWGTGVSEGAFNFGGNLIVDNGFNISGAPIKVGGSLTAQGNGKLAGQPLVVVGNVKVDNSGGITSENMVVGGNITGSGNAQIEAVAGKTLNVETTGNINLAGSSNIKGNVTKLATSTYTTSNQWGAVITGSITNSTTLTKPTVSVNIPEMSDPLASMVTPPTAPSTACTNLTGKPSSGTYDLTGKITTGGYYCSLEFGSDLQVTIPPGTYWTDKFAADNNSKVKMDGVHLYITGKNGSPAFSYANSSTLSMKGTMVYIKSGSFSITGNGAPLYWSAPSTGEYTGMALYMDRANTSVVTQENSTKIAYESGTWYAPASACSFTGNTATTIYAQFICSTVNVAGSSGLTIKYDGALIYQQPSGNSPSEVSLDE